MQLSTKTAAGAGQAWLPSLSPARMEANSGQNLPFAAPDVGGEIYWPCAITQHKVVDAASRSACPCSTPGSRGTTRLSCGATASCGATLRGHHGAPSVPGRTGPCGAPRRAAGDAGSPGAALPGAASAPRAATCPVLPRPSLPDVCLTPAATPR